MKIGTEHVECAICGCFDYKVIGQGPDYEFDTSRDVWQSVECTGCGHLFLNPRPTIDNAKTIYPSDYYPPLDFSSGYRRKYWQSELYWRNRVTQA